MRRVLLMISSMRGGGSERQTLLLLKHLDRSQFAPELYLTERAGDLLSSVPDDVPIHSFPNAASTGGFYFPGRVLGQQAAFVGELLVQRKIDVIYDRTFHMTMIAGPAAQTVGVARVSTIVSPPDRAVPLVEKRFVWLKRRRLAKAYRLSKAVVAVSRQAAISAESYYGLASDSIRVIPNPVDVQQLQQDTTGQSFQKQAGALTILCIGRMTEEKGHHDLLSAVEQTEFSWSDALPQLRLLLIGDGPLRTELERRWSEKSHRHRVEFLGVQSNPASHIAAADALVLPSHFEGMPNVVLEAMALCTPVIATRCGGTVELEADQPTILWANPSDPPSLADAIVSFARDPESARCRVEAAKTLIDKRHNIHKTVRQIEALLQ